jgi:hypothetical protein
MGDAIKGTGYCFARPLRDLLEPYMGLSLTDIRYERVKDVPDAIPYQGSIRDYFKAIAMATREVDPNFYALRSILAIDKCESDVVITDFRYPNEYEVLAKHYGVEHITTIRVHREVGPDPELEVSSENSLLGFEPNIYIYI